MKKTKLLMIIDDLLKIIDAHAGIISPSDYPKDEKAMKRAEKALRKAKRPQVQATILIESNRN